MDTLDPLITVTPPSLSPLMTSPLMTCERFAEVTGLPPGVVRAQLDRGYWLSVRVGRRRLILVEAVRIAAQQRAQEYVL